MPAVAALLTAREHLLLPDHAKPFDGLYTRVRRVSEPAPTQVLCGYQKEEPFFPVIKTAPRIRNHGSQNTKELVSDRQAWFVWNPK